MEQKPSKELTMDTPARVAVWVKLHGYSGLRSRFASSNPPHSRVLCGCSKEKANSIKLVSLIQLFHLNKADSNIYFNTMK